MELFRLFISAYGIEIIIGIISSTGSILISYSIIAITLGISFWAAKDIKDSISYGLITSGFTILLIIAFGLLGLYMYFG